MKRRSRFKKNLRNPNEMTSYYFNWNLYLCIISVRFGSSSVLDILLRHLHHTGIGNCFALHLPASVLSVGCSCSSKWSVLVSFLDDGKLLHTPNHIYLIGEIVFLFEWLFRDRLVYDFKNWKLLFKNMPKNTHE